MEISAQAKSMRNKLEFVDILGKAILIVTAFLVPVYFDLDHLSYLGIPKATFVHFVALVVLVVLAVRILKSKKITIGTSYLRVCILLFLFALSFSALLGVDVYSSVWSSFEKSLGLVTVISAAIIGSSIQVFFRDLKSIRPLLASFLLGSVVLSVSTYIDVLTETSRGIFRFSIGGGLLGNTSLSAAYMLFGIFTGLYLFVSTDRRWERAALGISVVSILLSPVFFGYTIFKTPGEVLKNPLLFFGQAQAAIAGLGAGLVLVGILYLISRNEKKLKVLGFVGLAILVFAVCASGYSFLKDDGFLREKYIENSTSNRFVFWDIAFESFKEKPVLGWGYQNFIYAYEAHFNPEVLTPGYKREVLVFNPHSILMDYLSMTGAVGLATYSLMIIFLVRRYWLIRKIPEIGGNHLSFFMIGLIAAYFIQGLFWFDTVSSIFALFLIIGVALIFENRKIVLRADNKLIVNSGAISVIVICLILLPLIVFAPRSLSKEANDVIVEDSLALRRSEWNELNDKYTLGILDAGYMADGIYSQLLAALPGALGKKDREELVVAEIDSVLAMAEKSDEKFEQEYFRLTYYALQLIHLRVLITKDSSEFINDRADYYLEKVLKTGANNPSAYALAAQEYLRRGDHSTASQYLIQGLMLAPENPEMQDIVSRFLDQYESDELRGLLAE